MPEAIGIAMDVTTVNASAGSFLQSWPSIIVGRLATLEADDLMLRSAVAALDGGSPQAVTFSGGALTAPD